MRIFFISVAVALLFMGSTGAYAQPGMTDSQVIQYVQDGLKQGRKSMAKELSHIIDKHLAVQLREDKQHNKVSQKAFEKFKGLLEEGE